MTEDERLVMIHHTDAMRMHCRMMEEFTNTLRAFMESKKIDRLTDALESIPDSIQLEK